MKFEENWNKEYILKSQGRNKDSNLKEDTNNEGSDLFLSSHKVSDPVQELRKWRRNLGSNRTNSKGFEATAEPLSFPLSFCLSLLSLAVFGKPSQWSRGKNNMDYGIMVPCPTHIRDWPIVIRHVMIIGLFTAKISTVTRFAGITESRYDRMTEGPSSESSSFLSYLGNGKVGPIFTQRTRVGP